MSFFFVEAIKMADISLRPDLENEERGKRRREKKSKPTTFWRSLSSSLERAASPGTTGRRPTNERLRRPNEWRWRAKDPAR